MDRRFRRASCLVPLALAACGGGVYFEIGDGFDEWPPDVAIAASPDPVAAGATLKVVAAATDPETGVESVVLYRLDGNAAVFIGEDRASPYEWLVVAPDDGRTTLQLFARATDREGNRADSEVVAVRVLR